MTLQTISKRNYTVLTIFQPFTKLHFGLSERYGLILDQSEKYENRFVWPNTAKTRLKAA